MHACMLQARTPLVATLDIDMLVSKDFHTSLLSDAAQEALVKVRKAIALQLLYDTIPCNVLDLYYTVP